MSVNGAKAEPRANGRPYAAAGESLLRFTLPPGTPDEARTAVQRLVELTGILARRCAQLQEALESRVVIEQAKGILAERLEVDPETAFKLLRRAARSNRMRLHDLAEHVITSRETPPVIVEVARRELPGLRFGGWNFSPALGDGRATG